MLVHIYVLIMSFHIVGFDKKKKTFEKIRKKTLFLSKYTVNYSKIDTAKSPFPQLPIAFIFC